MRNYHECEECGTLMPFDTNDPPDQSIICPKCCVIHVFDQEENFVRTIKPSEYLVPSPSLNAQDVVNHPSHYTSGPIECFDAMKSAFTKEEMIAYCKVAAFKYLWREGKKDDPIQERKKAEWYLQRSIELMEEPK